jgi:hypothetical protein
MTMPKNPIKRPHSALVIVILEALAFMTIIAISWFNEILGLTGRFFHTRLPGNWHDALVTTAVTTMVAVPAVYISWRIARRLHYLEEFFIVCAWCKKMGHEGDWIPMERFMAEQFNTHTSHGICDECADKFHSRREGKTPVPGSPAE